MNDINLLYVAIDGAAITIMSLLTIRVVSQTNNPLLAVLFVWICLAIIGNVITSRHDYGLLIDEGFRIDLGQLHGVFNLFRNSASGAFMLVCHFVFRDGKHLPRVWLTLWVCQILLEEPLAWILGTGWHSTLESVVYEVIPALLQMSFLAISLYWMIATREADLILPRRRARVFLATVLSAQAVLSLLIERVAFEFVWIPYEWQYPIHVLAAASIIVVNGILLFAAFSPNAALVLGKQITPSVVPENAEKLRQDDQDTLRIRRALEEELIYRTPGLSVRELAEHLAIPEYRLRSLVHEQLGFRNFNALLHHYRIEEVCTALIDPGKNSTPVLTLALTAGYQSINPFNRAFRERFGVTPTEFRKQQQVDS